MKNIEIVIDLNSPYCRYIVNRTMKINYTFITLAYKLIFQYTPKLKWFTPAFSFLIRTFLVSLIVF